MLHQKYIVKQMNVCRVAVGESNSAVGSAEFHWHKFQWGSNWWIQWVLCSILLNNVNAWC